MIKITHKDEDFYDIKFLCNSLATHGARPALQLIKVDENKRAVSTDGHRLHIVDNIGTLRSNRYYLAEKNLKCKIILKELSPDSDGNTYFPEDDSGNKLRVKYPDVSSIIPLENKIIFVNRMNELIHIETCISLIIAQLAVKYNDTYKKDERLLTVSYKYLESALENFMSEQITYYIADKHTPFLLEIGDNKRAIIMPIG